MASKLLGTINVDLEMKTASFEAAIDRSKKKTSELERFFANQGKTIVAGLGFAAIATGFQSAISAANEFNAGLANIASLMPGNSEQVKQFGSAIQDLSISSGKSTADLTAGMYQVVSAYGGGADAVERLRIVTEGAQAGLSTTEQSLALLSVTTKAYGDTSIEAMQKASDLAFKTVQLGQTTYPELASALQNVASEAANLGITQEELFASFSATTGVIGNASVVATKMKAALTALSAPGAELTALYEQMEISSGKALIAQEGLQGALEIVTKSAEASGIPLQKLIGSTEGISFATSVAGAQAGKFKTDLEGMGKAAGTTGLALEEQKNGIAAVGAAWDRLGSAGQVALEKLGNAIMATFGTTGLNAINGMTAALTNFGKALDQISGNNPIEEQVASLKRLKDEVAGGDLSVWDQMFGKSRKEQIADINKQIKVLESQLGGLSKNTGDAAKSSDELGAKGGKAGDDIAKGFKLATDSTKKAADAMKALRDRYSDTVQDIEKNKISDAMAEAVKTLDATKLSDLGDKLYKVTKEELIRGLDDSLKSNKEALAIADNLAKAYSDQKIVAAQEQLAENQKKLDTENHKNRLDALHDELGARMKIEDEIEKKEKQERSEMLQDYADAAAFLMNAINEGLTTGDWERVAEGAARAGAKAAVTAMEMPELAAAVDPLFDLGGTLWGSLKGDGEAGGRARDAIESFMEEILQANVALFDSSQFTASESQANWADAFGAIAGEGQTAFESLGTSIALLAGQSAEYGGQIGFILAQNLNGNLDAARLLVQSLGIDAEQMGQALMDAALQGEVSWAQWAALQAEVNTLTAEGLVGAGDLTGAWNQFIMTGGKGQMSLTALQNIAVEASEAGATSLADLQGVMRQLGISQEEVDRFIGQLRANGITNMDDLSAATDQTLGSIVAGVENAGQQWEDYGESIQGAIDQMSELEKKIRGIDDKEIDLTVNVKYKTEGEKGPTALGAYFENEKRFALGGIVSRPTKFSFGSGFMNGLMGEAGPEAIMPLKRDSRGRLGVISQGSGMAFHYSIDARGAGAGAEAAIAGAIKAAHRAAVRDSVAAISEAMARGAL